jgi:hypothetical protein
LRYSFLHAAYYLIALLLTVSLPPKEQITPMHPFILKEIISVTMILFAIIDILGAIPVIIEMRQRAGHIQSERASVAVLILMVGFLFAGNELLDVIGLDIQRRNARNGIYCTAGLSADSRSRHYDNTAIAEITIPNTKYPCRYHTEYLGCLPGTEKCKMDRKTIGPNRSQYSEKSFWGDIACNCYKIV